MHSSGRGVKGAYVKCIEVDLGSRGPIVVSGLQQLKDALGLPAKDITETALSLQCLGHTKSGAQGMCILRTLLPTLDSREKLASAKAALQTPPCLFRTRVHGRLYGEIYDKIYGCSKAAARYFRAKPFDQLISSSLS